MSWAASEVWTTGQGRWFCHSGETPYGVQCPALGPSTEEKRGAVGTGPEKGHQNGQKEKQLC